MGWIIVIKISLFFNVPSQALDLYPLFWRILLALGFIITQFFELCNFFNIRLETLIFRFLNYILFKIR